MICKDANSELIVNAHIKVLIGPGAGARLNFDVIYTTDLRRNRRLGI